MCICFSVTSAVYDSRFQVGCRRSWVWMHTLLASDRRRALATEQTKQGEESTGRQTMIKVLVRRRE